MVGARRITAGLAVLGAALALALVALPATATAGAEQLHWSAPTKVASPKGDTFLGTVSCPSTTVCTSAGELLGANYNGYVADFNPLAPGTVTPYQIAVSSGGYDEPRFNDVSCPSTTQCTAVNGDAWTYDPASPSGATSYPGYGRSISCPTTTECVAIQTVSYGPTNPDPYPEGTYVVSAFNPQAPAAHTDTIINAGTFSSQPNAPANNLFGLACPTTTECALIGTNNTDGVEWTFDPLAPSTPAPAVIDPGLTDMGNAHLRCPTASECVVVDRSGREVTFDPAAPGTASAVDIDPNPGYMADVACPSATQCTAIDAKARAVTFDPTTPSTQSVTQVAASDDLASIDCPSTSECVTIGGSDRGNLYVGQLSSAPPTGSPVIAKPAVRGTRAAVPITCKGTDGLACPVRLTLAARANGHNEELGSTARKIAPGHKATVTVALDHAGVKLLDKDKRLSVKLSIASKGVKTVTRTVTFSKRR